MLMINILDSEYTKNDGDVDGYTQIKWESCALLTIFYLIPPRAEGWVFFVLLCDFCLSHAMCKGDLNRLTIAQ